VLARAARFVERGRIFAAAHERRGRDVDLGHRRQIALSNGQFASSRTLVPPTRITTFAPLGFASDYWLLRERKAARGPITWLSGRSSAVTMSTWLKPSLRWTSNPPGTSPKVGKAGLGESGSTTRGVPSQLGARHVPMLCAKGR